MNNGTLLTINSYHMDIKSSIILLLFNANFILSWIYCDLIEIEENLIESNGNNSNEKGDEKINAESWICTWNLSVMRMAS